MTNDRFYKLCKELVVAYFNNNVEKTDDKTIDENDVFIVWICKTLQNHKALVSTTISDGMYYEITYNGDKNEIYFDAYKKWKNECIKLEPINTEELRERLEENLKIEIPIFAPIEEKQAQIEKLKNKGYVLKGVEREELRGVEIYHFKFERRNQYEE